MKQPCGSVKRNEFMALAQGLLPNLGISSNTAPQTIAAGQQLFIGMPAKPLPAGLLNKLTKYFKQIPELRAAYLFQMIHQNVPSTVIGLHLDDDLNPQRLEDLMRDFGHTVKGEIPSGMSIDLMPLRNGSFLSSVQKCGLQLHGRHEL